MSPSIFSYKVTRTRAERGFTLLPIYKERSNGAAGSLQAMHDDGGDGMLVMQVDERSEALNNGY